MANDERDPLLDDLDSLDYESSEETVEEDVVEQEAETEEPAAETEDVAETEAEVEALVEQAGEARELAEEADELDELFNDVVSSVQASSAALVEREEDVVSADAGYLAVFVPGEALTVPDFRARTSLGNSARYVLDTLIGQGYVQRDWKFGRGIYSLTEAGVLARSGN